MFFRFALVLCCVALGATGLIAEQPKLPKPPSGFKWQWNDEVSGGFLRPNGWYVKSVKQEDTIGLFITKENIDKEGKFKTGLSINVIPRIQKKTGMRASEYVKQFLAESAEGKKVLLDLPPKKPGRITTYVQRTQDAEIIVHNVVMADNQSDKMYLVFFESPVGEWESARKYWEPMLANIAWAITE